MLLYCGANANHDGSDTLSIAALSTLQLALYFEDNLKLLYGVFLSVLMAYQASQPDFFKQKCVKSLLALLK